MFVLTFTPKKMCGKIRYAEDDSTSAGLELQMEPSTGATCSKKTKATNVIINTDL